MNHNERLELLKEWETCYNDIDGTWETLSDLFNMYPDSPVGKIIWNTFELYTKLVSKSVGDNAEWLDWYCWENDMGKNAYEAKASNWKEDKKITSIEILCDLIEVDLK